MSLELSNAKAAAPSKPKSDTVPTTNAQLVELARRHLYPNYRPAPIVISRGLRCELFDVDGKRWLDLCAGVAVCSVGHAHPRMVRAISEQVARVMHVSNYFLNEPNVLAAAEVCRRTGMDRALFCNSGAEANEAMLKLARGTFTPRGRRSVRGRVVPKRVPRRTLGALAMTDPEVPRRLRRSAGIHPRAVWRSRGREGPDGRRRCCNQR